MRGMISRKVIIGIALTVIGLFAFAISYNQGMISQNVYSKFGCAVDARPQQCVISYNQIIAGFLGKIFLFFTALYGIWLIVPSLLMKFTKKQERILLQR